MGCASSKASAVPAVSSTVLLHQYVDKKVESREHNETTASSSSSSSDKSAEEEPCVCRLGRVVRTFAGNDDDDDVEKVGMKKQSPPKMRGTLHQRAKLSHATKLFAEVEMGVLSLYADRDLSEARRFNLSDYSLEEVELQAADEAACAVCVRLCKKNNKCGQGDDRDAEQRKTVADQAISSTSNCCADSCCESIMLYVRKEKEREHGAWLYCLQQHTLFR